MLDLVTRLDSLLPEDRLAEFSQRWQVRELALFGSVLRDDFGPESDIDVLVSFTENVPWSLWDLTTMADELSAILQRKVDLIEREGLRNPFRRDEILRTRKVVYVGS
jgi:predicted nucleotidyltransferase